MSCKPMRFSIAGRKPYRPARIVNVTVVNKVIRKKRRDLSISSKITAPLISKSDSTIPNNYFPILDMRLWSWELGQDNECLHTGLVYVGKVCKVIISYYSPVSTDPVKTTLSCINVKSGDIVSTELDLVVDSVGTIIMLEKSLNLQEGIYVFKITAESKIYILGFVLEG